MARELHKLVEMASWQGLARVSGYSGMHHVGVAFYPGVAHVVDLSTHEHFLLVGLDMETVKGLLKVGTVPNKGMSEVKRFMGNISTPCFFAAIDHEWRQTTSEVFARGEEVADA